MNKLLGKVNKKFWVLLAMIIVIAAIHYFLNKDVVTTYVGKMNIDSDSGTASLLNNGKVLIIAISVNKNCKTTEAYFDPDTNKFTIANERNVCDGIGSITVLPNDNVLFAGGRKINDALATASIFNTKTNKFIPTENLKISRMDPRAILISNNEVLILDGMTTTKYRNFIVDYSEIYNIKTGTFHLGTKMPKNFDIDKAILLKNGKVLILGRIKLNTNDYHTEKTTPNSFILYDIKSKKFLPGGKMNFHRYDCYSMTMLNNGNVLIAGGDDKDISAEIYDYKQNKFFMTGSMNESRRYHSATLLKNGKVLIAGGAYGQAEMIDYRNTLELYDPQTGKFSLAGKMREKKADQIALLLKNDKVIIIGGGYGNKILNTVELY